MQTTILKICKDLDLFNLLLEIKSICEVQFSRRCFLHCRKLLLPTPSPLVYFFVERNCIAIILIHFYLIFLNLKIGFSFKFC